MPNEKKGLQSLIHLQPLILNLAALCEETLAHISRRGPPPATCTDSVHCALKLTQAWSLLPPVQRLQRAPELIAALHATQEECDQYLGSEPPEFAELLHLSLEALKLSELETERLAQEDLKKWAEQTLALRRECRLKMMVRSRGSARLSAGDSRMNAPELSLRLQRRPHLVWKDPQGFPTHLSAHGLELIGPLAQELIDEASGQADVLRHQNAQEARP